VENGGDDAHWRESVMDTELMSPVFDRDERLSHITIGALYDMGYHVDFQQADSYTIPPKAVRGKPVAAAHRHCEVLPARIWP